MYQQHNTTHVQTKLKQNTKNENYSQKMKQNTNVKCSPGMASWMAYMPSKQTDYYVYSSTMLQSILATFSYS